VRLDEQQRRVKGGNRKQAARGQRALPNF